MSRSVFAVLVYELHGAKKSDHAALQKALSMVPGFKPTQVRNTWEIESEVGPTLPAVLETRFRGLLTVLKIQKADFRIYTASNLRAAEIMLPRSV